MHRIQRSPTPPHHGQRATDAASRPTPRRPYLPHLDGLRALAVSAVLLYHADVPWMPGGFLGVDVFFVLSGYLITALLLREWQADGQIDLVHFWTRRARRLLPALLVLIAATLAFALIWLPDEVVRLRGDALAALAYSTNWYQIFKHESYFETMGRPSLFQHLWSLAVEAQFYLVWPPVLAVLLRWRGRRGALLAALVGAAGSAALMAWLYQPDGDASRVYYGTDTRVFAPLLGAALACIAPRGTPTEHAARTAAWLPDALAFLALVELAAACVMVDEYASWMYSGGFVVIALLAALTIAALTHPAATWSRRTLSFPLLRWLGTRSYAIYLWHWPVFMVTRPELDLAWTGWPLIVVRLGVTFGLAELSYRWVERPVRAGALGRGWRNFHAARGGRRWRLALPWALGPVLACSVVVVLGVAVVEARPPAAAPDQPLDTMSDPPLDSADTPANMEESPTLVTSAPLPVVALRATDVPHGQAALGEVPSRAAPPTSAPHAATPTSAPRMATHTTLPSSPTAPTHEAPSPDPTSVPASPTVIPPTPVPTHAPPVPTHVPPVPAARMSAIGDSVMVGASPQLRATLGQVAINAAVARQAKAAIQILQAQRNAGKLGAIVIVHIGTNGPLSARQFDQMMRILADVPRVVFVTVHVPRRWEGPNNRVIMEGVTRYPNTVLADWHAASAGHPELFARDGVHPTRTGARLFANVIAAAVNTP